MEKRSFQQEEFEHRFSGTKLLKKLGLFALSFGPAVFTVIVINL